MGYLFISTSGLCIAVLARLGAWPCLIGIAKIIIWYVNMSCQVGMPSCIFIAPGSVGNRA